MSDFHVEPQVAVTLAQAADDTVEQGLITAFRAALATGQRDSAQIAALVARDVGRGAVVTPEAERGAWTRYRVGVRVLGMPVTIATVEVTQAD